MVGFTVSESSCTWTNHNTLTGGKMNHRQPGILGHHLNGTTSAWTRIESIVVTYDYSTWHKSFAEKFQRIVCRLEQVNVNVNKCKRSF